MSVGRSSASRITAALERCRMHRDRIGFWEVRLREAIDRFRADEERHRSRHEKGVPVVARELDLFHRSLSRSASTTINRKRLVDLSAEARVFLEMRLRLAGGPSKDLASLDLADPQVREELLGAAAAARLWLSDKPGAQHGAPIRMLVRDVALVYHRATGKRPGLTSSGTVTGPSYATPFEDLLVAVLTEAGTPLSLEASRSLYRSELRDKPKKLRPKVAPLI